MSASILVPTLLACLGFGAGTAMMKHGMATRFPALTLRGALRDRRVIVEAILRNKIWTAGALINLAGGVFQILALSRGDITLVQPLVNMNIVLTVGAGVFLMGERVSRREAAGVVVVVLGAVLLGLSAGTPSVAVVDRGALRALFVGVVALATLLGLSLRSKRPPLAIEVGLALMAGCLFGLGFAYVKVVTIEIAELGRGGLPPPAALAGFLLGDFALWMILAANLAAFFLMQGAFSHGRVSVVSPLTTIAAILIPVVAGIFVFHEAVGPLRASGIAAVVAGTALLALPSGSPRPRPS